MTKMLRGLDHLILEIDAGLKTLLPPAVRPHQRSNPAITISEPVLSPTEARHVAGLMRVNHSGEVCAQALYQGQGLTARDPQVRAQMQEAAAEETDHLAWCEARLAELNSQPSLLNPLWYSGAFLIGAVAGLLGDQYSLGFVAETEKQVSRHLQSHLQKCPVQDNKTRAILEQMNEDETRHAQTALNAGGVSLPKPVQTVMAWVSKIMTTSSYRI